MSQPLLSVNGLMMRFGGLLAVNNVNLDLHKKEIVSLIGPNGAGKTTVFNCLTGFYKPTGGTISSSNKADIEKDPSAVSPVATEETEDNPFTPDGSATVVDNATDEQGKEFYTIMTPDENVFYLIIDKQRDSENVYFLNAVTESDLMALAQKDTDSQTVTPTAPSEPEPAAPAEPEEPSEPETSEPEPEQPGLALAQATEQTKTLDLELYSSSAVLVDVQSGTVLAEKGMVFSGTAPDDSLVEIIELKNHPWFLGCQFHPEFKSRPMNAHPLFRGLIAAAAEYHAVK